MKLNLGAGNLKKEGYVNVDNNKACNPDLLRDIGRGLPYADCVVEEILAEHLIEHLPAEEFIFFFNECHRVLRDGGILHLKAPYYKMKWAYIDPTHIRFITEHSFDFFVNRDYNSVTAGVTGWYEPVDIKLIGGELDVVLKKVLVPVNKWMCKDLDGGKDGEQKSNSANNNAGTQ